MASSAELADIISLLGAHSLMITENTVAAEVSLALNDVQIVN